MGLLLDTHIVLASVHGKLAKLYPHQSRLIDADQAETHVSVVSIWEIAIKFRLGKLELPFDLAGFNKYLDRVALKRLNIVSAHALAEVRPLPETRDPFDRLLLAQCAVENLRLVTVDRALVDHPLAAR